VKLPIRHADKAKRRDGITVTVHETPLSRRSLPPLHLDPLSQFPRFGNVVLQLHFQHQVHGGAEGFFEAEGHFWNYGELR
jgi:hypothetical protein